MFDELMKKMGKVKDEVASDVDVLSQPIEEKDEDTYLGISENRSLPTSMHVSLADQKRRHQGSLNMAMGTVNKSNAAEQAFQKLRQAVASGYKPTAAEMMAAAKYQGKQTTVVPTAEDVKRVMDNAEMTLSGFDAIKKAMRGF